SGASLKNWKSESRLAKREKPNSNRCCRVHRATSLQSKPLMSSWNRSNRNWKRMLIDGRRWPSLRESIKVFGSSRGPVSVVGSRTMPCRAIHIPRRSSYSREIASHRRLLRVLLSLYSLATSKTSALVPLHLRECSCLIQPAHHRFRRCICSDGGHRELDIRLMSIFSRLSLAFSVLI